MVVNNVTNNVKFVEFLKQFERDISGIPWNIINPCYPTVVYNLNILFTDFIKIETANMEQIENLLSEIDKHTHNRKIKNLVISEIIYKLKYESIMYNSNLLGETIIKKHLFGMS